jgi:rhodanese-related sulfurtransferase
MRLLMLIRRFGIMLLLGLATCQQRQPDASMTTNPLFATLLRGMLKESVPFVSVAELKARPAPVLLDTRAPEEFAVSHLRSARWVGYDEFSLAQVQDLPKDTPIVVYCSIGARSEKIGQKLHHAGFSNVRNLYGGLFEWVNQGNPVFSAPDKPTDRVHAYSPSWGIWLRRGQKVYK